MGWSIALGRVFGISVRLHLTFLLTLAWLGLSFYAAGGGPVALQGILIIVLAFASVLLHEFGHALTARRFGIQTPDITLLPIGGVARLERIPEVPRQELAIALAGPAVNAAIALVLYLALRTAGGEAAWQSTFAGRLLAINLWLAGFNLVPAFPMDGGRILRALLAERGDYAQATQTAAAVGQGFAFLFALLGLLFNPLLLFIGLFVYLGAANEASLAQMQSVASNVPVQCAMIERYQALNEEAPLFEAIEALLSGVQRDFPVVDGSGQVKGVLTRDDLLSALNRKEERLTVGSAMQTGVPSVHACDMLSRAFRQLQATGSSALPVVNGAGRLVGLLTKEHVADALMIRSIFPSGDRSDPSKNGLAPRLAVSRTTD